MKILLCFLLLIIFSAVANAQADADLCLSFHTGTFAYRNDSLGIIHITRTSNKQQEKRQETGDITTFKIKWLAACSYELKQVWSSSKKQRKQNGSVTKVVISHATKNSYEFSCACSNDNLAAEKITGTVVRIFY